MSPGHSSSRHARARRTLVPLLVAAVLLGSGGAVAALSGTARTPVGLAVADHRRDVDRAAPGSVQSAPTVITPSVTSSASPATVGAASGASKATAGSSIPVAVTGSAARAAVQPPADCIGAGRSVVRPGGASAVYTSAWAAPFTRDDVTYDLSDFTSTAYPSTRSPIAIGTSAPGRRTCVVGGTVLGQADAGLSWTVLHDQYNAACIKIVATDWMHVSGLRCDNVEDGIRPAESGVNANNTQIRVSGTYLSHIRDDCIENDYTVGGVLSDSLWESCNTGISERPSQGRSWATPSSETLTLDHMLIGLYPTPHVENGQQVIGENALFKWSTSGNHVVIRCSTFKVDSVSLNGRGAMSMPPGTVVDDSQCPGNPSTLVWLGGGAYPGWTAGMRVVGDPRVWTGAVSAWKAAHGF
jgi:hypothetical protein